MSCGASSWRPLRASSRGADEGRTRAGVLSGFHPTAFAIAPFPSSALECGRNGFSLPGLQGRSITRVSIPEAVRLERRDDRQWFLLLMSKGSLVSRGAALSAGCTRGGGDLGLGRARRGPGHTAGSWHPVAEPTRPRPRTQWAACTHLHALWTGAVLGEDSTLSALHVAQSSRGFVLRKEAWAWPVRAPHAGRVAGGDPAGRSASPPRQRFCCCLATFPSF